MLVFMRHLALMQPCPKALMRGIEAVGSHMWAQDANSQDHRTPPVRVAHLPTCAVPLCPERKFGGKTCNSSGVFALN